MSHPQYGSRPIQTPERVFLLGDVHNEADKLMSVIDQLTPQVGPNDHIVFCGDLVDRGPDAALTIETLILLSRRYPDQVFYVEGNHDLMLRDYLSRGSTMWMQYLKSTLDDLQLKWNLPDQAPNTIAAALMAKGWREVVTRTVPYYETPDLIATHAPFDTTVVQMNGGRDYKEDWEAFVADPVTNGPMRYLLDKMIHELKWQFTDEYLEVPWITKFKVCGHQAGRKGVHPRIYSDRAYIDTACGLRPNGRLTCLVYPGKQYFQSKDDET